MPFLGRNGAGARVQPWQAACRRRRGLISKRRRGGRTHITQEKRRDPHDRVGERGAEGDGSLKAQFRDEAGNAATVGARAGSREICWCKSSVWVPMGTYVVPPAGSCLRPSAAVARTSHAEAGRRRSRRHPTSHAPSSPLLCHFQG
jgi:hypothetical protein